MTETREYFVFFFFGKVVAVRYEERGEWGKLRYVFI